MARRAHPFDSKTKRHTIRFGELEAPLADADVAQLHDALVRLYAVPPADVRRLRGLLRQALEDTDGAGSVLDLDLDGARGVQVAVYADERARRPVSPALAEARMQAFRYLESQGWTP